MATLEKRTYSLDRMKKIWVIGHPFEQLVFKLSFVMNFRLGLGMKIASGLWLISASSFLLAWEFCEFFCFLPFLQQLGSSSASLASASSFNLSRVKLMAISHKGLTVQADTLSSLQKKFKQDLILGLPGNARFSASSSALSFISVFGGFRESIDYVESGGNFPNYAQKSWEPEKRGRRGQTFPTFRSFATAPFST